MAPYHMARAGKNRGSAAIQPLAQGCLCYFAVSALAWACRRVDEMPMSTLATGTFEVKIIPQAAEENVGDPLVGRMSLDKEFHGELQAVSKGQMLAVRTGIEGSAGYVAIERVVGSLGGRKGSFALQHSGTMRRGAPSLLVTVIPDSGTDELVGLDGKMAIIIADGVHRYEFEYSIGDSRE